MCILPNVRRTAPYLPRYERSRLAEHACMCRHLVVFWWRTFRKSGHNSSCDGVSMRSSSAPDMDLPDVSDVRLTGQHHARTVHVNQLCRAPRRELVRHTHRGEEVTVFRSCAKSLQQSQIKLIRRTLQQRYIGIHMFCAAFILFSFWPGKQKTDDRKIRS